MPTIISTSSWTCVYVDIHMEMGEKKKGEGGGKRERRNRSRRLSQWYLKS